MLSLDERKDIIILGFRNKEDEASFSGVKRSLEAEYFGVKTKEALGFFEKNYENSIILVVPTGKIEAVFSVIAHFTDDTLFDSVLYANSNREVWIIPFTDLKLQTSKPLGLLKGSKTCPPYPQDYTFDKFTKNFYYVRKVG